MNRSRPRPMLCACMLALIFAGLCLAACATAPVPLHSWGGEWPWADPRDGCTDFCSI